MPHRAVARRDRRPAEHMRDASCGKACAWSRSPEQHRRKVRSALERCGVPNGMRPSRGAELSRSQTQFYNRYCSAVSFRRLLGCWGTTLSSDSQLTEMVIEMLILQYPPAATRNT